MGKAYGPEFLVQISIPFWVTVSRTTSGRHFRCSRRWLLGHFRASRAARRGTSSVRFGMKPSCMYVSRKPSLPLRVCSCCDDLGSLPLEKLV
jgi:hypothetical protein